MGEAAVKVAKAVGYYNAGTVEFIYQDGEFFFLEMNTRLQVEHPVTEVITGIDLVEWQIRVASRRAAADDAGRGRRAAPRPRASRSASTPRTRPAASSCRRPARSPSSSRPTGSASASTAATRPATTISQYYDNLVGKLIVWGKDRPTAIARTIRALEEMVVEGVATTIPADLAILRHPDFQAVEHSTKWVEERLDLIGHRGARRRRAPAGDDEAPLVERTTTVEVNGKRFDVKMWVPERADGGRRRGRRPAAKKPARAAGGGAAAAPAAATSTVPMQGTIVKVLVEVGQTVEAGQAVVVLEAMKMENQITGREGRHRQGDQGRRRRHRRRRRRRRRHRLTRSGTGHAGGVQSSMLSHTSGRRTVSIVISLVAAAGARRCAHRLR